MLTMLGTVSGSKEEAIKSNANGDVEYCQSSYDLFIRALNECNFTDVVKELRRTERKTKFGEMLPPVFTYFMDLSSFLRQYSHIAIRLGEEEKHLVQTFIDGKLDMQARTMNDKYAEAQSSCQRLEDEKSKVILLLEAERRRVIGLEVELKSTKEAAKKIEMRMEEVEKSAQKCIEEMRAYRHFQSEQEQLELFLVEEFKKYKSNFNK